MKNKKKNIGQNFLNGVTFMLLSIVFISLFYVIMTQHMKDEKTINTSKIEPIVIEPPTIETSEDSSTQQVHESAAISLAQSYENKEEESSDYDLSYDEYINYYEDYSYNNENIARKVSDESPYEGYFTEWMDLQCRMDISEEQINTIIEYYTEEYPDSLFKGTAGAFIKASKKTGYDPIFLLSLAAHESGWEVSELHREKCNPYSIAMYDWDPYEGYTMGNTFAEGIVNGAMWVKENYYDKDCHSLWQMQNGYKIYATDPNWLPSITKLIDESYKLI